MTTTLAPALSVTELMDIVRDVAAHERAWRPHLEIPDGAERWWTRLRGDDQVDVWLLSWLPGHSTDLHDHGPSAAAFSVVQGRLSEVRVDAHGAPTIHSREPHTVVGLGPGVVHDVHGAGIEPAVSIHAYSPPLRRMNYYGADADGRLAIVRSVVSDEPEEELAR